MISTKDSEEIINYIRNVWYDFFSNYKIAPLTLVYDPLSQFTGVSSGLAHIAHDSKFYSDKNIDPDSQILIYDPKDGPYSTSLVNLSDLPDIECILVCSTNAEQVNFIFSKLKPNSLVIVLNDAVTVPDYYQCYTYKNNSSGGYTQSYTDSTQSNLLKNIRTFIRGTKTSS
jgi:hypothetical protein